MKNWTRNAAVVGMTAMAGAMALMAGGCELASGMMESYYRNSTRTIQPEWTGLKGKSIGVLVAIDPALHTQFPQMELYLTARVLERLASPTTDSGVTGFVSVMDSLSYSANHPGWIAKSAKELAEGLGGVDAVVVVEIDEFKLHDPGNMYTWDGVVSGTIGVYDMTGPLPNEYAFRKPMVVRFPDEKGVSPESMPGDMVSTELLRRFIDRTTWLFYTHEEPYYPKY